MPKTMTLFLISLRPPPQIRSTAISICAALVISYVLHWMTLGIERWSIQKELDELVRHTRSAVSLARFRRTIGTIV